MRLLRTSLVCCLLLALTSCKQSQYKDAIVGKWQALPNPAAIFEFTSDGKISTPGYKGTYRLDGSDNIWINTDERINGKKVKRTAKVSIKNGILTLTDPDGKTVSFKKL